MLSVLIEAQSESVAVHQWTTLYVQVAGTTLRLVTESAEGIGVIYRRPSCLRLCDNARATLSSKMSRHVYSYGGITTCSALDYVHACFRKNLKPHWVN